MSDLSRIQQALTSTHRHWEFHQQENCPPTLISALRQGLPHIRPDSWEARLCWGGVFVNGQAASAECELTVPCRIEYFEPKFDIEQAGTYFPSFSSAWIVFEDEDLLVVCKPAGLPSLPVREQKHFNLRSYLMKYVGAAIHLPSRLDTSTSGLVVVSKSERMHSRLQRAFEKRRVTKHYLLEVSPRVDWPSKTVEAAIARDTSHAVLRKTVAEGGKPAVTTFELLYHSSFPGSEGSPIDTSILLARPLSGRTHQIRVHALSMGHPIIGDNFYGGLPAETLHLLSYRIRLFNSFKGQELDFVLPNQHLPAWLKLEQLSSL